MQERGGLGRLEERQDGHEHGEYDDELKRRVHPACVCQVEVQIEQRRRYEGVHGHWHGGEDHRHAQRKASVDRSQPAKGCKQGDDGGNARKFDGGDGEAVAEVAGKARYPQPHPYGEEEAYGACDHESCGYVAKRRRAMDACEVEPYAQGDRAQHDLEHGFEAEAAEGEADGLILGQAEPLRYGVGHREVEDLFAEPVERGHGDGRLAVEKHGDEAAHGADVGEGAAAEHAARLPPRKPHHAGKEDGGGSAQYPCRQPQEGQGEQPSVGGLQPPEGEHGRHGDEPEHGDLLDGDAHFPEDGFRNRRPARDDPLPEGIAGDEADEDDGEREQESVHGVAGAEAENRARLLVLNC